MHELIIWITCKCVSLGFLHLDLKEFQVISRVDIIFSLPIRHGPSKSLKGIKLCNTLKRKRVPKRVKFKNFT